jgi:amino acid transporter
MQSRVHPKTQTPVVSVLFCGCVSAVLALFVPLEELSDLTSMGALFAFCVVCAGVMFRWAAGHSHCHSLSHSYWLGKAEQPTREPATQLLTATK